MPGSTDLFDRELVYVTGKGGVGRTTVAAALGLAAARRGRRTIVCEVGDQHRVPAIFGAPAGEHGAEVAVADGLWSTSIDPMRALEEWIARQLGSRQLTHALARSNAFQYFVAAAPGARELVTITKAHELAQEKRWDKRATGYDLVVVDAPASGHGVGLLRTAGTFADIARVGPIAAQAGAVRAALRDPARSAYVAVALPSELPVTETLELEEGLGAAVGHGLDRIVCNAVLPRRFAGEEVAAVSALDGAVPATVRRTVVAQAARVREQQTQLRRLRRDAQAPVVTLPFVAGDVGAAVVGDFAATLERR